MPNEKEELAERVRRVLTAFGHDAGETPSSPVGILTHWISRVSEWNQRIDLTAARSTDELVDLLLADAAAIAQALGAPAETEWVDVGSGAGAPGLGLALLVPALRVTLVEPKSKRVAFLRSVVGELELDRVRVERGRSSELPASRYGTAISRATLPPPEWLEEGSRLARGTVWVLLARGEPPGGGRVLRDLRYSWPLTGAERRAVEYAIEQH